MSAPTAAVLQTPLRNSYWVVPGLLLAGEHPNGPTRDKTKDRLKKLMEAGIECFVDLTKPTELLRYDTSLPFYVAYTRNSIKDHGIPSARSQMTEILEYIAGALRAGRPVYVHCRAGIGRTGTVVGCLLAERGLQGSGALDELNRLWQQCRRSRSWPYIPETDAQAAYVREWEPTLASGGFDLSSLASAVATVGPMTADAAIRGTGRAGVAEVAAGTGGRSASSPAGNRGAAGGGLRAAAEEARAAVERGEISPSIRSQIADAMSGRAGSSTDGAGDAPPHHADSPSHGTDDPAFHRPSSMRGRPNGRASNRARTTGSGTAARPGVPTESDSATDFDAEAATGAAADVGSATRTGGTTKPGARAAPPTAAAQVPAARSVEPEIESDPLLDSDTLEAARGLRERFVGTLFGLAVGDAVAAATQFRRPGSFSPIGDMLGGGPFDLPRGAWSDDTAMALCLAESLLERDSFDARDQVQRYSRWQQEGYLSSTGQCVGITANTARSLALAKWRRVVFPGSHDPEQLDPEPLSRVASIALFYFASLESTLLQAADSSRTTCQAPAVLDACRRLGRALHAALTGKSKAKILAEGGPVASDTAAQMNTTAASALASALWAFGSTDNFRDAVLRAANLGGNSDVVAAVCGQLAGAHYGAAAIPQAWRSSLIQKDLIEGFADRLLAHGLVSLSS